MTIVVIRIMIEIALRRNIDYEHETPRFYVCKFVLISRLYSDKFKRMKL